MQAGGAQEKKILADTCIYKQ